MKVLVVDDEPLARERLERLLGKLQPQAACLFAASGEQALEVVSRENPDLVLLDIRMPGIDGIEVAARLDDLENPPAIIFCTAYGDHALEALQHQVVAYLLKPVREAELERALGNAGRVNRVQLASLSGEPDAEAEGARSLVTSQSHRGIESMPLADVRCFVAEDKYVTAYGPQGSLIIPDSLKELEQELRTGFIRVHRNALVALAHVVALQRTEEGAWVLELDAVEQQPQVSRRHLKDVRERLLSR